MPVWAVCESTETNKKTTIRKAENAEASRETQSRKAMERAKKSLRASDPYAIFCSLV